MRKIFFQVPFLRFWSRSPRQRAVSLWPHFRTPPPHVALPQKPQCILYPRKSCRTAHGPWAVLHRPLQRPTKPQLPHRRHRIANCRHAFWLTPNSARKRPFWCCFLQPCHGTRSGSHSMHVWTFQGFKTRRLGHHASASRFLSWNHLRRPFYCHRSRPRTALLAKRPRPPFWQRLPFLFRTRWFSNYSIWPQRTLHARRYRAFSPDERRNPLHL